MQRLDPRLIARARPEVSQLPIYDAGLSIDRWQQNSLSERVINLSVNENPLGMSPMVVSALQPAIETGALYPDSDCQALRSELARVLTTDVDQLIIGNGSEDILSLLCKVFINPGDTVMIAKPTFSLHRIYPQMMGADIVEVPIDEQLNFNYQGWLDALDATPELTILMLANPSNPVGCRLSHDQLTAIVEACGPDTLLVIDEAYVEYAAEDPEFPRVFEILKAQTRPWIVLRTFSKAYGLAGMRVGYGICSSATCVDLLNRVRTPYNVNRLAQIAARHAFLDQVHLQNTRLFTLHQRDWLRSELEALGYTVAPSASNFLFFDARQPSSQLAERLLANNLLVKAWKEPGFDTFIRVSIGSEQNNQYFVHQMAKL